MWDTVVITLACVMVYVGVGLLCPTVSATQVALLYPTIPVTEVYVGRHGGGMTVEEYWMKAFIEAWSKGEERWLRYAWIETWPETVSWL